MEKRCGDGHSTGPARAENKMNWPCKTNEAKNVALNYK